MYKLCDYMCMTFSSKQLIFKQTNLWEKNQNEHITEQVKYGIRK